VSETRFRLLAAALAALGLGISIYLSISWYSDTAPACVGGGGGCETVQNSDYSELAGVPVALIGAVGYGLILLSLLVPGDPGRFAGALLALVAVGFSLYLTYLELFVIDAVCQWCVASAVVSALLAATAVARLLRAPAPAS
jgi:uncharacterized membrane protein